MHGTPQLTKIVPHLQTGLLTVLAMTAFAVNSLLCREALKNPSLDAASFTTIRLVSGAVTLWLVLRLVKSAKVSVNKNSWPMAVMLFAYATAFSFAYLQLNVATGSLILFGAVQGTMMLAGFCSGERLNALEWSGFFLAAIGFFALVYPGLSAPSLAGSSLMFIAGTAWGIYTLFGRVAGDSITTTATNFILAAPLGIMVSLLTTNNMHITSKGLILATTSGALASGGGYIVWYSALKGLTALQASIVQLSVPILAAAGGVIFLSEQITLRLLTSGSLILGGVVIGLGGLSKRHRDV